jgi:hypothetical protein
MVDKQVLYEEILPQVSQPVRYVGNELNSVRRGASEAEASILLAFPDVYEVGMSYIGFKILYEIVNSSPRFVAERAFAPWPDMEAQMRLYNLPLYGLETYSSASSFDVIGFTLQYELTYTNVLAMLDLAGVPLRAEVRTENDPIVIAGGPCGSNPEPIAAFFDLVVVGDGEEVIVEIMSEVARKKREGAERADIVNSLSEISGVYCPRHKNPVRRRVVADLDEAEFPRKFVVPFLEAVHDRVALEVMRGCTRGCRFCQAGAITRIMAPTIVNKSFVSAPAAYIIAKNTGASTSAEPRSFCATTSPIGTPTIRAGMMKLRRWERSSCLERYAARATTTPILTYSEGCIASAPILIQLMAPFVGVPKTKTLASMTRLIT